MIPTACGMDHACVAMRLYRVFNILTTSVIVLCVNVPNMPWTSLGMPHGSLSACWGLE